MHGTRTMALYGLRSRNLAAGQRLTYTHLYNQQLRMNIWWMYARNSDKGERASPNGGSSYFDFHLPKSDTDSFVALFGMASRGR
jgi:hypothetical protein